MQKLWMRSTLLIAIAALSSISAMAQNEPTRAANGQPMPKPSRPGFQSKAMMESQALSQKVSLPNLPDFTGQGEKFMGGLTHHADKGQHYIQHFQAKEDARQVLDWYLNTMNMYKWKIQYSDATNIMAKQPNATCSVFVHDIKARRTGYNSEIEINYFESKTR